MRRDIDEAGFYLLDKTAHETGESALHGPDGGPFPYESKRSACSAAAKRNGRFGKRRFVVVTWITLREVAK